jgi:sugar phosphate isomerase/epimerase
MQDKSTRRHFLKVSAMGAGVSAVTFSDYAVGGVSIKDKDQSGQAKKVKFELGMASYTLRQFGLDETLAITTKLGLRHISLKAFHMPLDSTPEVIDKTVAKVKKEGLDIYGVGVIYMTNADEVNKAFEYAKAAQVKVLVGVPNHDLLPLVEEKVKEYDIKLAIHIHGPGDQVFPTSQSVYEKLKGMDKRMGICFDIGHTMRSGIDPSEALRHCADRVHDVHLKDVSDSTEEGYTVGVGQGVIDIPGFLRTLIDIDYSGIVSLEHDRDVEDIFPILTESVGYTHGVLDAFDLYSRGT